MSRPSLPLLLSPQAEEDFTAILQYTLETWGEKQLYSYRTIIDKALSTIQKNPQIGQQRQEISPLHRTFPAGQHIVIYRVLPDAIHVSRILHERMDIKRHLR